MDMELDGTKNSVSEVNVLTEEENKNPLGNAFYVEETIFKTEKEAQRKINLETNRYWKVLNPNVINKRNGVPVSYKLVPGANSFPL